MGSFQGLNQLFPFLIIFFIFYILVIKPEQKKKKEKEEKIANIKKNDKVVTAGGLHGTVAFIKEGTVVLRFDDNVRIEIDKEAIATVKS